jgi:phage terminase large subunit-like protein
MSSLDYGALDRWRRDPCAFISEVCVDPETGQPFDLLPAERVFLDHAFKTDDRGRLLYPEQMFSAPKKSGKTAFAALHVLTTSLIFGGAYPEAYCIANDLEQAQGRVFAACKRIVEMSPLLRAGAHVTADKIEFATGAAISAVASDYAGAAGANPTISSFDELWGYTSERSRRLWDELVPPPTRKIACRLTTTYAGFEGESLLLEELYKRGLSCPQVGADLYAGGGLLMFWSHTPIAPWQTAEWIEQMRGQLRPNAFARMIENSFVSAASVFVDMEAFDACVDAQAKPLLEKPDLPIYVAVDASVKRDSTAIVAVSYDHEARRVRLVTHKIFQPSGNAPLNFEATIERTLLDLQGRFRVRSVHFDPYQMQAVAQRLGSAGVPMFEFAQTPAHLTAMGSNLYELVKSAGIVFYPDDDLRLAMSRAVAVESERGLKITKAKSSHKVDVVVALAMAAWAAVDGSQREVLSTWQIPGVVTQPRIYPGDVADGDTMTAWLRTRDKKPFYAPQPGERSIHHGAPSNAGNALW